MSDSSWPHGLPARQAPLSFTISQSLLKFMSFELVILSNHLILCSSFSFRLHSFPPSGSFPMSRFFCTKWPMHWKFSFSISSFSEYLGLISFRIDWFNLVAQGTLKSSPTPQFKSINSLVLKSSLCSNSHIHAWLLEK